MRVALAQMTSVPNLHLNIKFIEGSIIKAKKNNADLIVFPENCGFMGRGSEMFANAYEEAAHPVLIASRIAANNNNINVLLGSIAVLSERSKKNKLANRSIFLDRKGTVSGRYDKINMFDANLSSKEKYNESNRYAAGSETVVIENELGRIGLTICFDIRFPELYQKLSHHCLLYTSPSPRDATLSRMPASA